MIRSKVYFTGLEIDPANLIQDRCIQGIIPSTWQRTRFAVEEDVTFPISKLNRWLAANIEGRWAAYTQTDKQRHIVLAFENDCDGLTFMFANGKQEAFKETDPSL